MVPECSSSRDLDRDKGLRVAGLAGVTETTNTCSISYQGLRMCQPYQPDSTKEALGSQALSPCFVFAGETAPMSDNRKLKPQSRHCLFASLA